MKNLLKTLKHTTTICLSLLFINFYSCTKEETETSVDETAITQKQIEKVYEEIKSLGDSQGKIVTFELSNLSDPDYQQHFKVLENSKKILDFNAGADTSKLLGPGDNYVVTCIFGNGETETTECGESAACAGAATWKCLDEGGCARVCNARVRYTPGKIIEEKVSKKEALNNLLQQVEEISKAKHMEAASFTLGLSNDRFYLKKIEKVSKENIVKSELRPQKGGYQVDCWGGDGNLLWSGSYNDTLSASQAILDCTDRDGGCADICEIQAFYYPGTSLF
ncbi:MAG: hypothetical protein CL613_09610 [Aquimarina sp.]|nr:hypothetical protein [Aquimarina sp.]